MIIRVIFDPNKKNLRVFLDDLKMHILIIDIFFSLKRLESSIMNNIWLGKSNHS